MILSISKFLSGVSRSEDIRQEDFQMVVDFLEGQIRALTRKSQPPNPPA